MLSLPTISMGNVAHPEKERKNNVWYWTKHILRPQVPAWVATGQDYSVLLSQSYLVVQESGAKKEKTVWQ